MILYHGTAAALLPLILKQGLKPHGGKGADAWAEVNNPSLTASMRAYAPPEPSVFVTSDLAHAAWFAQMAAQVNHSEPAVVRVELPDNAPLKYDENGGADYLMRYPGPIEPAKLSELPREYWRDAPVPSLPVFHGDLLSLFGMR